MLIVVSLFNAKAEGLFWYGFAEGKIKATSLEDSRARLDYAVTQIFKTLK